MMKSLLFTLMLILTYSKPLPAQPGIHEKTITTWLEKQTGDSVNFVRIVSLTDKYDYPIKNKQFKLSEGGIYEFYDVRSHTTHYLFEFENNQINFITDYRCDKILELYWHRADKLKRKKRHRLLEGLMGFIYRRELQGKYENVE